VVLFEVGLVIFYAFLYKGLSRSDILGCGFGELVQDDSSLFFN
jgi:hypothetical protein